MKTRNGQGTFILLIWTLIAKVKQLARAPIVLLHPGADLVVDLLLWPLLLRSVQRRQAEEARLSSRVYRFSSLNNASLIAGAAVR
jgi:hypothetical protein